MPPRPASPKRASFYSESMVVGRVTSVLTALAAFLGLVYLLGAGVLWIRLAREGLPTEAVITSLPRELLLSIGLRSIFLPALVFAGLGALVLIVVEKRTATSEEGFWASLGAGFDKIVLLLRNIRCVGRCADRRQRGFRGSVDIRFQCCVGAWLGPWGPCRYPSLGSSRVGVGIPANCPGAVQDCLRRIASRPHRNLRSSERRGGQSAIRAGQRLRSESRWSLPGPRACLSERQATVSISATLTERVSLRFRATASRPCGLD
jgi:hypothetical protein